MRLDNYLSKALDLSRKDVSILIKKKEIQVNDKIILKKDFYIDESKDVIKYNGTILEYKEFVYYMLNKPKGVVSAVTDKVDKTVVDLISTKKDIFPVGRLDKDTVGLLILTNDGTNSHKLTSPNNHVEKEYYVELENDLEDSDILAFENGLEIRDGDNELFITKPAKLIKKTNNTCNVIISEGKFHQIKRMFEKLNNKVTYLKRVRFGEIRLDPNLVEGSYRELTNEEIEFFKNNK